MPMKFNPATGQYEDDGTGAGAVPGIAGVSPPIEVDLHATNPIDYAKQVEPFPVTEPAPPAPTKSFEQMRGMTSQGEPAAAEPPPGAPGAGGQFWSTNTPAPGVVGKEDAAPAEPNPFQLPPAAPAGPAAAPINIGADVKTERVKQSKQALAGQAGVLAAEGEKAGLAARQGDLNIANAKDEAMAAREEAAQKAQMRADEMQQRLDNRARLDAANAERDRIIADAQKQSTADYWSDKPAGAKVLADFASAAGTYVAIKTGSGINFAQQTIDKAFARDDAKKQQILKNSIYRAGLKGQDAKDAYEFGLQEISLRKSAVLDKLADERAAKLAARGVPAAEIQKDAMINAAKETAAQKKADFGAFQNVKIEASNASQQRAKLEQLQAQQKTAAPATLSEREKAEAAAQQAVAIDKAHKIMLANPKAWQELQDAKNEQSKANMVQKTKLGAEVYNTLAATGAINSQLEQRLKSKAAKELNAALGVVITAKARDSDPVGALNQEAVDRAEGDFGFLTRGRDEVIKDIAGYRTRKLNESRAAVGATGYVPPSIAERQGPTAQAPAPAPRAPLTNVQRARLTALLDAHPNDPRAAEARARLAE